MYSSDDDSWTDENVPLRPLQRARLEEFDRASENVTFWNDLPRDVQQNIMIQYLEPIDIYMLYEAHREKNKGIIPPHLQPKAINNLEFVEYCDSIVGEYDPKTNIHKPIDGLWRLLQRKHYSQVPIVESDVTGEQRRWRLLACWAAHVYVPGNNKDWAANSYVSHDDEDLFIYKPVLKAPAPFDPRKYIVPFHSIYSNIGLEYYQKEKWQTPTKLNIKTDSTLTGKLFRNIANDIMKKLKLKYEPSEEMFSFRLRSYHFEAEYRFNTLGHLFVAMVDLIFICLENGLYMTIDPADIIKIHSPICLGCHVASPTLVCGSCETAAYCSDVCADTHWVKGGHYRVCK